jgi:hypothetical protein
MPALGEPWFLTFYADVEWPPTHARESLGIASA